MNWPRITVRTRRARSPQCCGPCSGANRQTDISCGRNFRRTSPRRSMRATKTRTSEPGEIHTSGVADVLCTRAPTEKHSWRFCRIELGVDCSSLMSLNRLSHRSVNSYFSPTWRRGSRRDQRNSSLRCIRQSCRHFPEPGSSVSTVTRCSPFRWTRRPTTRSPAAFFRIPVPIANISDSTPKTRAHLTPAFGACEAETVGRSAGEGRGWISWNGRQVTINRTGTRPPWTAIPRR